MKNNQKINVDDINFAIYKIGDWKNNYEFNQIGLSREIPVTKPTLNHIKLSMEEIRSSEFQVSDKKVNGFVAIAMQLNSNVHDMDLDEMIELEEKEYGDIISELDNLELIEEGEIPLDSEDYLIYKLEKDCHVTNSIPANDFTRKFYEDELKRIEDALS